MTTVRYVIFFAMLHCRPLVKFALRATPVAYDVRTTTAFPVPTL